MPTTADHTAQSILHQLGVTSSPGTLQALDTALRFFSQHMPALTERDRLSILRGMDLHSAVEVVTLIRETQVAAFRYLKENPLRLFYTVVGSGKFNLGVNPMGREFRRFRVLQPTTVLKSKCTSVKMTWTDDPTYVGIGGGIQFIIPDAKSNLALISSDELPKELSSLSVSTNGVQFLFRHEAQQGVSNHLHWPGGGSGVTIGPGYDMKLRASTDISVALQAIGIAKKTADLASLGATLTKQDAKKFAEKNVALLSLSNLQERQLLKLVLPIYEDILKSRVTVPLRQHEYDALVSFVYNTGDLFMPIANAINEKRTDDAMKSLEKYNKTNKTVSEGLTNRRADEIRLYRSGTYGA